MDNWIIPVLSIIIGVAIGILISRSRKKKTLLKRKRVKSSMVRNRAKAQQPAKKNNRGR